MRARNVPALLAMTLALHAQAVLLGGGKPAPTGSGPWRCSFTIDNQAGDTITNDGGGPYVDGSGGVTCNVLMGDPTSAHYGWLYVAFSTGGPRFIAFAGQPQGVGGPAYAGFTSLGKGRSKTTFEVKELGTKVSLDASSLAAVDVLPFRSYVYSSQFLQGAARFRGDSNVTAGADLLGTSSVFVAPHADRCGWDIWLSPNAPLLQTALGENAGTWVPRRMELSEGSGWTTRRGYYAMEFFSSIRVISGRDGCPPTQ